MIEGFQEALALQEPFNFLKEVISSFSAKACVEFTTLTRIWLETPRITPFLFVTDGIEGLYTSIREWKTYVRAHPHLRIFLAMAVPIMKLFSDPTGFWRPPPPPPGAGFLTKCWSVFSLKEILEISNNVSQISNCHWLLEHWERATEGREYLAKHMNLIKKGRTHLRAKIASVFADLYSCYSHRLNIHKNVEPIFV